MLSFHIEKEKDDADSVCTPSTVRKANSATNLTLLDPNRRKSSVKILLTACKKFELITFKAAQLKFMQNLMF